MVTEFAFYDPNGTSDPLEALGKTRTIPPGLTIFPPVLENCKIDRILLEFLFLVVFLFHLLNLLPEPFTAAFRTGDFFQVTTLRASSVNSSPV